MFDFDFMGGSMGSVVGEKIARGDRAGHREAHCRCSSSPPRAARACRRAILSLMQMAKTSRGAGSAWRGRRLPFISVLTDPTTGGVTASFAMLGDVIVAEPRGAHRLRRAARHRADDTPLMIMGTASSLAVVVSLLWAKWLPMSMVP